MKNPIAVLVCLLALAAISNEVLATLQLPDEEFEFAAPTEKPMETVAVVAPSLKAMGFNASGDKRETSDGRFRAIFRRGDGAEVILIGRAACVHVGIFTSGEKQLAQEFRRALVDRLRAHVADLLLFEASGCERAL
jgi:hypothetical protein